MHSCGRRAEVCCRLRPGAARLRTALIAGCEVQNGHNGPMLIVILVPSIPPSRQWVADVAAFGINAVTPGLLDQRQRAVLLEELRASLETTGRRTEVMVLTNKLFSDDRTLRSFIDSMSSDVAITIVGDEVHNLGAPSFISDPPERFDYRLGLSATPFRQYDPDGSDRLFGNSWTRSLRI